jgi:L-threonylcarbamoyladenylate synthase
MSSDIAKAVEILKAGGLVAFPTETVYGLGADATNPAAIKRIFETKGRPSTNPLIVHVADIATAKKFAASWPKAAQMLAEKFWPGSLTLVLPKSPTIVPQVTANKQTVGLRAPNHPLALDLLRKFNGPLAAPSANRSTRISPTTAQHVCDELGDKVDLILDGGPCTVGIESTVLDLTASTPTILRPGAITAHQIEEVIGPITIRTATIDPNTPASSPGQHAVHYSPRAAAYRFEQQDFASIRSASTPSTAVLALHPIPGAIQMPTTPEAYARILYSTLRDLDSQNIETIFIEMPPDEPQWLAVRDRLLRATRPFPSQAQ